MNNHDADWISSSDKTQGDTFSLGVYECVFGGERLTLILILPYKFWILATELIQQLEAKDMESSTCPDNLYAKMTLYVYVYLVFL